MNNFYCRNCGKKGHKYKECRNPRLSYGIILFNDKKQIIMIERKDSISFIEFIRGKYKLGNNEYIQLLFNRMSNLEKEKIKTSTFKELWDNLWYNFNENNMITFATRKNRKIDFTEFYDLLYQYRNDCLTAAVHYNKEFYADSDVEPTEQLFFSLTIVPLGAYETKNIVDMIDDLERSRSN